MASWNKITYSKRLFLWLLGYSLVLVGSFIIFQYHREKEFKAKELNAQLQLINGYILSHIQEGESPNPMNLKMPHPFEDLRVSLIDSLGQVIYDNSIEAKTGVNHLTRKEISEAIKTGSGFTIRRHSESTGNTYFYSATRGKDGMIVRTAVPYSVTLSGLLKADYGFLWIMGGISALICLLGWIATRRMGQNIIRLNKFAERAERGERIYDSPPFPKNELGAISSHIVRLYSELQGAIAERDKEHRQAMHQQKEKERIKKQLTNNINHELKTPVASIRLCLETMSTHKNMSEEKREEFVGRCLENTYRLGHLLEDVSLITRLDEAPQSIAKETVDLVACVNETVEDYIPVAEAKGMKIKNNVKGDLKLTANRSLICSIFRNLIDNAIAYSGGTEIKLDKALNTPQKVVITVEDNGCGIEPQHLPRIFERFYRVDEGRSRQSGGTGLGLSIVKNAVLLHGGTISAENLPEGGLLFTIVFPKESENK